MPNVDLATLLGATVDRTVMNFIDAVGEKFDVPTADLVELWDRTSTGGPVTKKSLKTISSESSSVSEVKVAVTKGKDDGTDSSESQSKPLQKSGRVKHVQKKDAILSSDSDSDAPPTKKGKEVVLDSDSDDSNPPPKRGKAAAKKKATTVVEEDSDSEESDAPPPKRGKAAAKKVVEEDSDDSESDAPPPKRGKAAAKKVVEEDSDDSESDAPPPKRGKAAAKKKVVEEDSDSEESDAPPPKRGKAAAKKKVVEEDSDSEESDAPPPKAAAKKAAAKKAPAKGKAKTKRVYEEVDEPEGGPDYPSPPKGLKFLKGTNYIVHDGKVVAGWSKRGFMALNGVHKKSLDSEVNQDIEYEQLKKEELDEMFDMVSVNSKIAKSKPPAKKRGKK